MRLQELGQGCLKVPVGLRDVEISALTCDSRAVRTGGMFVAVRGETVDGHSYLAAAERAGATVTVGDRPRREGPAAGLRVPYLRVADSRDALGMLSAKFHGSAHRDLKITGITGTKGKTTTAWILDTILRNASKVCGLFGTVHNRVADDVLPTTNTTPSSLEFHRLFADLKARGGTHAVLEVSSHGIIQRRTAGFQLRVGLFTNIAPEHLDYHRTFENYFDAKMQLFRDLPAGSFAVLPREESAASRIQRETPAQIVWYGTETQDGVEKVRMGAGGTHFVWKGYEISTPLWGQHNLLNLVGAMAAAECLGLSQDEIAGGAALAHAPPGRLEEVTHPRGFRVFVDYAHTDGSLETVLRAVRSVTHGRVITIFGCGGDRDREKRPRMGRVAEAGSDHIVVTSDNPRCEPPESILDDILQGLKKPDDAVFEPDRRAAIALAIRMAQRDDTVLIAGKGHETYQEFQAERVDFNDREVAREFLLEGVGGEFS